MPEQWKHYKQPRPMFLLRLFIIAVDIAIPLQWIVYQEEN
jgi:hypothetical protein